MLPLALALLSALAGCGGVVPRLPGPPPAESFRETQPVGYGEVRFFGDRPSAGLLRDFSASWRALRGRWIEKGRPDAPHRIDYLILSGGAADGAFGVGVLNGWTDAGDRPRFRVVSGVSTGALIAPYAFLGSAYDAALREVFLSPRGNDDLFDLAPIRMLRGALALTDSTPLRRRIETAITPEMVEAIAAEHAKGRRLLIGTTHLDARLPVVWDLGAIASSGAPDREALIEQVLLASASIPGLAPPVPIRVAAGGAVFEELHVDGGVGNTLIYASPQLSLGNPYEGEVPVETTVWVIQNNKLYDSYQPVEPTLGQIVGLSVSELIRSQARGDQVRVYHLAERDGLNYRLAQVPQDFRAEAEEEFDPRYTGALYQLGYDLARTGYPWRTAPPGYGAKERVRAEESDAAQGPALR
ncbi:MAG: patatin-like phospholipase family protein [Pseudomonadota bacterium]